MHSLIEFTNDKYDHLNLNYQDEHMNLIDNYDDVLENCMKNMRFWWFNAPELVFLLILASESTFHFSKSFETKIPVKIKCINNSGFVSGMFNGNNNNLSLCLEINIQQQRENEKTEQERKANMKDNNLHNKLHNKLHKKSK